jgi:hypothetical protein
MMGKISDWFTKIKMWKLVLLLIYGSYFINEEKLSNTNNIEDGKDLDT